MSRAVLVFAFLAACNDAEVIDGIDDEEPSIPDPADDDPAPPPPATLELTPGCTATATLAGFPAWFHFTRPDNPCRGDAGSGIDHHAIDELVRLIGTVPAGGR